MERLKDTEDDETQGSGRPSEIRDGFVLVLLVSILHYLIRCFCVNKQHNNVFVTFDISIITTTVVNIAGLLTQNEDQSIKLRDFPFPRACVQRQISLTVSEGRHHSLRLWKKAAVRRTNKTIRVS